MNPFSRNHHAAQQPGGKFVKSLGYEASPTCQAVPLDASIPGGRRSRDPDRRDGYHASNEKPFTNLRHDGFGPRCNLVRELQRREQIAQRRPLHQRRHELLRLLHTVDPSL